MESNPLLFRDLAYIFVAAMAGGFLAWRLNLPLILGFVAGGIVISPFTPGLRLSDVHTFHEAAEAGVVLLMFSIGVEFSVPDLLRVKWVAVGGGTLLELKVRELKVTRTLIITFASPLAQGQPI